MNLLFYYEDYLYENLNLLTHLLQKKKSRFTLLGILASVIWGSGSAFGRSMAETYGNFSSTGLSNVSAGVILTAVQIKRSGLKSYGQDPHHGGHYVPEGK